VYASGSEVSIGHPLFKLFQLYSLNRVNTVRGGKSMEEYEGDKVQVRIYLDFSEESEKAINTAWHVAEEMLDEYGVWVEIEPIHLWVTDPLGTEILDLPKIEINGKTMFIGRAPTHRELIEAILDRIGKPLVKPRAREVVVISDGKDGFCEAVIID